tara:strand:+ start:172 stop:483 length:312 start_codon:yes stop_codon:yes gene_type:complete
VNTIKKFKTKLFFKLLFIIIFLNTEASSLTLEYENELLNGCYINSKKYLGTFKAKKYCLCTVKMLSKKFNNEQIDEIFKEKPEIIMKKTEFASIYCEKNTKDF